jgi:tetraprenyl-beta-curcumene synthase
VAHQLVSPRTFIPWLESGKYRTRQGQLLFTYIFSIIPLVEKRLSRWEWEASICSDRELRKQALASIKGKKFHCQGGAFFAVKCPRYVDPLVDLIVAYQTLCDYLDNLCDRANCTDQAAFFQLHTSLLDALSPDDHKHDYYRDYPYKDDSGYIDKLVQECKRCISGLPSYACVYQHAVDLARLYIHLQAYKHAPLEVREDVLTKWAAGGLVSHPQLLWQEFAAASGSTLGIFALFALACDNGIGYTEAQEAVNAYFPWICGLHILLDYMIDQQEDRLGGDLNFTFYYRDQTQMQERLQRFITEAIAQANQMTDTVFTRTIIEGLLAMYLSDRKVKEQGLGRIAQDLVATAKGGTGSTLRLCQWVRKYYKQF